MKNSHYICLPALEFNVPPFFFLSTLVNTCQKISYSPKLIQIFPFFLPGCSDPKKDQHGPEKGIE